MSTGALFHGDMSKTTGVGVSDWVSPMAAFSGFYESRKPSPSSNAHGKVLPHRDIGPLINLGTQHDGRSARTWMKRVLITFVSLWEGKKDLLESTKMDFYET